MSGKDKMELEYEVSVKGLGEAAITADSASRSANQAALALTGARSSASKGLPVMLMSVRSLNAARLAVEQTSRAFTEFNLTAAMYGFLNMIQVVRNLTSLTIMLKNSTGAAAAAQGILATLTGRWWLIPLALAAGALIYSKIKSMQMGGTVERTGVYYLHKGETVVPSGGRTSNYGPIYVTIQGSAEDAEPRRLLDKLGPMLNEQARRGG